MKTLKNLLLLDKYFIVEGTVLLLFASNNYFPFPGCGILTTIMIGALIYKWNLSAASCKSPSDKNVPMEQPRLRFFNGTFILVLSVCAVLVMRENSHIGSILFGLAGFSLYRFLYALSRQNKLTKLTLGQGGLILFAIFSVPLILLAIVWFSVKY